MCVFLALNKGHAKRKQTNNKTANENFKPNINKTKKKNKKNNKKPANNHHCAQVFFFVVAIAAVSRFIVVVGI